MRQLALDLAQPAPPTLDNFVAGGNAEPVQSLKAIAAGAAGEGFIYLWGAAGSGRSHLLRGFVAAVHGAGRNAWYLRGGDAAAFEALPASASVVAVDDVQRLDAQGQLRLFNLYNRLRESGGALVAAGDVPPARLQLRQDLATRLAWGLVYEVRALSDDEKTRALKEASAARGLSLPDEVCAYLLAHASRDMPSLLAMVEALDRHSLERHRQITVPLARELLKSVPDAARHGGAGR